MGIIKLLLRTNPFAKSFLYIIIAILAAGYALLLYAVLKGKKIFNLPKVARELGTQVCLKTHCRLQSLFGRARVSPSQDPSLSHRPLRFC